MASERERVVVDTNVAVAANGRDTHADVACQLACVHAISKAYNKQQVVLDDGDLIMNEYAKHLHRSGEPGVGDAFFKYLFQHSDMPDYVRRVSLTPCDDVHQGFAELPVNSFDPDDRKFLAAAVVANATIMNAMDSDWHEQRTLIERLGVAVEQLCPQHAIKSASLNLEQGKRSTKET